MKPLFHFDPVLMINFWFFVGWTPTATTKYLRKHWNFDDIGFERKCGRCIEFDNDRGKHAIVIWTRSKPKGAYEIGTLAHECVHATNMAFSARNVRLDLENDETQAYFTAHLVRVGLGMKVLKNGP